MKRVFQSIYLKFILVFVGILWLSSGIAFFISFHLASTTIELTFKNFMIDKTNYIISLNKNYSLSLDDLNIIAEDSGIEILLYKDNTNLKTSKYPNINITDEELEKINNGEIVFKTYKQGINLPYTLFKIDNEIFLIMSKANKNMISMIRKITFGMLLACACIGSFLFVIAIKIILKPIKKLSTATKEVAKGNFDVEIKTKSKDEFGQLVSNFNYMTRELKNIEYLQKDFISNVSHEFKTPMMSIQGFAKLIKKRNLPTDILDEYTDIIISETERLSILSSNLLNLSQLENKSIKKENSIFLIDEQIRKVILILETIWKNKNIEFELNLEKSKYFGDEKLIQQVWINLIGNAVKFSKNNGFIRINATNNAQKILVSINNNGIGIDKNDEERIFDKFYKGDKSRNQEGNGLGLSIVKKIIEYCDGKIYFESSKKNGTTFYVEL